MLEFLETRHCCSLVSFVMVKPLEQSVDFFLDPYSTFHRFRTRASHYPSIAKGCVIV